ncbi:MAG: hypothetical protein BRC33_05465 [Cyanobacteria bacterium SW_9_44_58]|nr:MAG: hypothetical protein BRC33_05465 [Cyanobacteria bacterium SW_9_44_58]
MEQLSNINPFIEGRKPPSDEQRKKIAWQRQKQQREEREQLLRELNLMGESYPQKILQETKLPSNLLIRINQSGLLF